MKRAFYTFTLVVFLLASCVPAGSPEEVGVIELSESVSYYPQEAGASWQYLPSSPRPDEPRVLQTVEGPTVVGGELWVVTHIIGQGLDNRFYRQYLPAGVFLMQEIRPGLVLNYDPPIQEFPPEGQLRVGATWGGETTVGLFFPEASADNRQQRSVEYRYTVVDSRRVELPVGNVDTFVVDFEARFLDAERNVTDTQKLTTWFTPHIGEIKTENDYFLVATNVQ